MGNYAHIIFFSLIGGMFSLLGGVLLLSNKKLAEKLQAYGMPFAAGALLAAVFLDLLKDGLEQSPADQVLAATLIGIFLFFFAERFLRWFHHHHQHDKYNPSTSLVIVGDTVHNALDGVAIAAAFLVSVPTGIVTTMAIAAHEIPQEIGDFGLLLSKGMKRKSVLLVNILSSLATVATALIVFTIGKTNDLPIGILLGISAGFLLYIALSDIIPTIHEKTSNKRLLEFQPLLMLLGAALVAISVQLAHNYIHHDDEHQHSGTHQTADDEYGHAEDAVNTDENGIPHGEEGHDHESMEQRIHFDHDTGEEPHEHAY